MDENIIKTEIAPYQITTGVWMVPCQINTSLSSYIPSVTPFENNKKFSSKLSRKTWSSKEDKTLKEIVKEHGAKNWTCLALFFNTKLYNGLQARSGKQCRERWLGSLRPGIVKRKWTAEEDSILISFQMANGNKWSIAKNCLPRRSETQIKNRWKKLERIMKLEQRKISETRGVKSFDFLEPWANFRWDKFQISS